MISPPRLIPGDAIGIAATARKITTSELEPGVRLLSSWGLKVRFADTLLHEHHQFGGIDRDRINGFQQLLDDPDIKAIIIARGGYGTVRIIDHLDFTQFKKHPKWIVGFSDITVLHAHIQRHCGIQTIHGPMMINFTDERIDPFSADRLRMTLMEEQLSPLTAPTHSFNIQGQAKGVLTGGNLSVLYSMLGSPSDVNTHGCILFLEDLDEYLYHIDRMMMNLMRNQKLNGITGLIVGDMSDMKDNTTPFGQTAYEIIRSYVSTAGIPVAFGFPAGHERLNMAMKFGAEAHLSVSENGALLC